MEKLFPYQEQGSQWLASRKCALLADEMGLGKSAQAIIAADRLEASPILVLCPAVARLNWMREWQKFSSRILNYAVLLKGADASRSASSDVTICSYDLLRDSAVLRSLSQRDWSVCVLDESHFLKSRNTKRTVAALGFRTDRLWALSGTPAPNNPSELWPLLKRFGAATADYWSFVRRYCDVRETPFGTQITGGKRLDELRSILAPYILRRRKDEVMKDLPKIFFQDLVVEATEVPLLTWKTWFPQDAAFPRVFNEKVEKQLRAVESLTHDLGLGADSMKILEGLDSQVKSLRQWVGLQKLPKVVEVVKQELDAGAYQKIVLFAVHKMVIEELEMALHGYGAVKLYGGTSADLRERYIKRFQNKPECRVFIGQTVAAGTAITLTAAHNVMVVEPDWTPANNAQAVMRVHRIGQTKPVTVRFVGMAGSYDERITQILKQKTRVLAQLFD